MSSKLQARFKYALQPVLLLRQWDLDALKLELATINDTLKRLQQERDKLQLDMDVAKNEWKRQSAFSDNFRVDRFTVVMRYLDDLGRQLALKIAELAQCDAERDKVIDQIARAQRGLEAIEQHRDDMSKEHAKQLAGVEFKSADDHWSTLQTRGNNDH